MDSKVLPDPPEEYERVGWLVESFHILSNSRQYTGIGSVALRLANFLNSWGKRKEKVKGVHGLLPLPISFTEINQYMTRFKIADSTEASEFIAVIQGLDLIMQEHILKK